MTNSPVYSEQLKLNAYWSTKDRTHELPGSIQSPDRFVRGSYYVEQLPATSDPRQALAGVMSVMRNISVPWGTPDPEHPNISPTWWRTLIDQKNRVYYFDSALSPQMVWVNLNQIDVKPGSGVRAIQIEGQDGLQGNVTGLLQHRPLLGIEMGWELDPHRELGDLARHLGGHGFLHPGGAALQGPAMAPGHNPHDREDAGTEGRRHQVGGGKALALALVIGGGVGFQQGAGGAVAGTAAQRALIAALDAGHSTDTAGRSLAALVMMGELWNGGTP